MFKIGDKVKIKEGGSFRSSYSGTYLEGIVIDNVDKTKIELRLTKSTDPDNGGYVSIGGRISIYKGDLELINNTSMTNVKEKFAMAFVKEPQKSFRQSGVTDSNDMLTADGKSIFLSWLLHGQHADAFKKEVVDLLKEDTK